MRQICGCVDDSSLGNCWEPVLVLGDSSHPRDLVCWCLSPPTQPPEAHFLIQREEGGTSPPCPKEERKGNLLWLPTPGGLGAHVSWLLGVIWAIVPHSGAHTHRFSS